MDFDLERRSVILGEPIKSLGEYTVPVRLHPEVEVPIEVQVRAEEGVVDADPSPQTRAASGSWTDLLPEVRRAATSARERKGSEVTVLDVRHAVVGHGLLSDRYRAVGCPGSRDRRARDSDRQGAWPTPGARRGAWTRDGGCLSISSTMSCTSFTPRSARFTRLETLWGDAPSLRLEDLDRVLTRIYVLGLSPPGAVPRNPVGPTHPYDESSTVMGPLPSSFDPSSGGLPTFCARQHPRRGRWAGHHLPFRSVRGRRGLGGANRGFGGPGVGGQRDASLPRRPRSRDPAASPDPRDAQRGGHHRRVPVRSVGAARRAPDRRGCRSSSPLPARWSTSPRRS